MLFALSMSMTPVTPLPPRVIENENACVCVDEVSSISICAPFAVAWLNESLVVVLLLNAAARPAAIDVRFCWLGV